ncbi:MAG: hypothetical protein MMC33_007991 [Icmadophila ericetorum]|nr:hypothetical protein [Icmadophila ericetorum]
MSKPPDAEWMLWAKKITDHYKEQNQALREQIQAVQEQILAVQEENQVVQEQNRAIEARLAELKRCVKTTHDSFQDGGDRSNELETPRELFLSSSLSCFSTFGIIEAGSGPLSWLTYCTATRRPSTATTRAETVLVVKETPTGLEDRLAQGGRTLLEYFNEVDSEHRRRQHDLVQTFLRGMNCPYRREALKLALGDNQEWSLENLGKEIRKLQEDAERQKKRRRRETCVDA